MAMGTSPVEEHQWPLREQLMRQLPGHDWETRIEVPEDQDPSDNQE